MLRYGLTCLLAVIEVLGAGVVVINGSPATRNALGYEEYVIEHEISTQVAKNAALAIDFNSLEVPAGCQKCTRFEIVYCLGRDFINDHCCCDMRYHEYLPFVPHTCYLGEQLCKPVVEDCAVYNRLRECCCNKYILSKWKSKGSWNKSRPFMVILLALFICLFKQ